MRAPGLFLLLVVVILTTGFPEKAGRLVAATLPTRAPVVPVSPSRGWRYAETAPFHAVVPDDIQNFTSTAPERAADVVCTAMGGTVAFLESERDDANRLEFLCRFEEPDLVMSVEFGELHRILGTE